MNHSIITITTKSTKLNWYLIRPSKPLSDRYLTRPIILLSILAQSKSITVPTAAITQVTLAIVVAALGPPKNIGVFQDSFLESKIIKGLTLQGSHKPHRLELCLEQTKGLSFHAFLTVIIWFRFKVLFERPGDGK